MNLRFSRPAVVSKKIRGNFFFARDQMSLIVDQEKHRRSGRCGNSGGKIEPIAGEREIEEVVFPVLFHLIHGSVGSPDQFFRVFHVLEIIFLKRADPHTDRDGKLEVVIIKNAHLYFRTNALGNELCLAMTRAGHENNKLLASESNQNILAPAETLEEHGHIPEQPVTGKVTVGVIDLFEVIQIDEETGKRCSCPA